MKDKVKQIHFIGMGGVGMAGIAEVCLNLGYQVTGSDLRSSPNLDNLLCQGARAQFNHQASLVKTADVVVVSSAIEASNPEIIWAKSERIPVIPRAEMLAELMRMRFGIAIAGTHGKTTTTSLTAAILTEAGLDPTYVIGGRLNQIGSNARLGQSQYLVAEADESDASFLHLMPMICVVTNIDEDHMDTYEGDYARLEQTFIEFVHRLPFYGDAILCVDHPNVRALMPKLSRKITTYGFDAEADIRGEILEEKGLTTRFKVQVRDGGSFEVTLNLPGLHNVANALASIAVSLNQGVEFAAIQRALRAFSGVGRRFEVYPQRTIGGQSVTLVDDYGHHPVELEATLSTARKVFPQQRLVLVFQLHRYTRTRDLFDDFVQALMLADLVILPDVYAAGEPHLPNFDAKAMLQALRLRGASGVYAESLEKLDQIADEVVNDSDVVLVMGAGNIGGIAKQWSQQG